MWDKVKYYLLTVGITGILTFVYVNSQYDSTYNGIISAKDKTIKELTQLVENQKTTLDKTKTETTVVYDKETGKKIKETVKVINDIKTVEKTHTETKVIKDTKYNTILVGVGTDPSFTPAYSVVYIKRWEFLNAGAEFKTDKSASIFVGVSF